MKLFVEFEVISFIDRYEKKTSEFYKYFAHKLHSYKERQLIQDTFNIIPSTNYTILGIYKSKKGSILVKKQVPKKSYEYFNDKIAAKLNKDKMSSMKNNKPKIYYVLYPKSYAYKIFKEIEHLATNFGNIQNIRQYTRKQAHIAYVRQNGITEESAIVWWLNNRFENLNAMATRVKLYVNSDKKDETYIEKLTRRYKE